MVITAGTGMCEYLWQSAEEAFSTMVMKTIEKAGEKFDMSGKSLTVGTITFSGSVEGMLSLCLPNESANSLACSMMMADNPDDLSDEEVDDAVGEITNLVIGGFKTRIQDSEQIDISIPTITRGDNLVPTGPKDMQKLVVRANTVESTEQIALILCYRTVSD